MEKHFAALKLLDSDSDWKLTQAFSYSSTPSLDRICLKQSFNSDTRSNLIRQYSCEQIFDKRSNARQIKVAETLHSDDKRCLEYQAKDAYFESFKSFSRQGCKSSSILQAPKFVPRKGSKEAEDVSYAKESIFSSNCAPINTNYPDQPDNRSHMESRKSEPAKNTKSESNPLKPEKVESEVNQVDAAKSVNRDTYKEIKSKLRPLVERKMEKRIPTPKGINMCYCSCLTFCVLPLIVAMFALLANWNMQTICNRATLFSNVSSELLQKIHGQEAAISRIVAHLDEDLFYLKVLCLLGGTGVGKSYTAEIIAESFPFKKEVIVYDTLMERYANPNSLNWRDSYQLLIVENLRLKNLDTFASMIDSLSEQKDKCITVIAIFNVEEVNDNLERKVDLARSTNVILEALASKKVDNLLVPYLPLSDEVLEMCAIEAAVASNLKLTSDQINEVKQGLLASGSGCKGAYAKVQVVGRN